MNSNYATIIEQNLAALFDMDAGERGAAMGATTQDHGFALSAFGRQCRIMPDGIWLDDQAQWGPIGIILTLYALNATAAPCRMEPLRGFKDFPGSAPYVGAFRSHCEQILVPAVDRIVRHRRPIEEAMEGRPVPAGMGGDAAMVVFPLPKIALCYIFYEADEDFPASATCLFSTNADRHMPLDGLADVGEYTSRAMLELVSCIPG